MATNVSSKKPHRPFCLQQKPTKIPPISSRVLDKVGKSSKFMIDGVKTKKLKVFSDDRGFLMEVIKKGDEIFKDIKQTTYTEAYPGVIKAFHWHEHQTDIWFFTSGMAQVVLYDLRKDSPTRKETQVFYMGEKNPVALLIPPGVAHGYRVLGIKPAGLFYHTTEIYNPENPDEERLPFDNLEIGFDWETKNK